MKIARKVPKVYVKSRHTPDCKYSGSPKKLGCACPKQLIWTQNGKEYRVSAETADREVAESKARKKEQEFERVANLTPEQIAAEIAQSERKTIAGVRDDFLAAKKAEGVSQKHIDSKIGVLLDALVQHCAELGIIAIADVTLPLLENWRNSWEFSRETARKKQQILKSFFEYALHRDYVTKNPAKGLGRIKGVDRKPTLPLDDAQFAQLLAAIPKLNGQTTDDTRAKLRGIMLLQRWTGLAIKDAVLFERKRLVKDSHGFYQVFLYRAKTGNPVYCVLGADIAKELLAIPNSSERYMFVSHVPSDERELESLIAWWASRSRRVGDLAQLKDEHGDPMAFGTHQLRDTFAVWCLNEGFGLEEVAALLGDSPQVVAEHYAPWVKSRQDVLTKKMRAALAAPVAKRA